MRSEPLDPFWAPPRRVFASSSVEWTSWTFGFAWWSEAKQFQILVGPLAVTFNAWAPDTIDEGDER